MFKPARSFSPTVVEMLRGTHQESRMPRVRVTHSSADTLKQHDFRGLSSASILDYGKIIKLALAPLPWHSEIRGSDVCLVWRLERGFEWALRCK